MSGVNVYLLNNSLLWEYVKIITIHTKRFINRNNVVNSSKGSDVLCAGVPTFQEVN